MSTKGQVETWGTISSTPNRFSHLMGSDLHTRTRYNSSAVFRPGSLVCDGRMNFIEQNLSAGLFPPCLKRALRWERIPVKTLHPFLELGIIIVTHEDCAMFREL